MPALSSPLTGCPILSSIPLSFSLGQQAAVMGRGCDSARSCGGATVMWSLGYGRSCGGARRREAANAQSSDGRGPSSAGAKKQRATPWSWARRLARSRGVRRRRRAEARGRGAEQWHRAGDRATTRNSSTVAPGDHDQRFIRGGRAHRDPQISLFRRTRELLRGASPGKKSR